MVRVTKDAEERKNELMDAALELFLKKGFDTTTITDIVKRVGVAQGLFYYYFGSKHDMLDAVIDRYIDNLIESLANIASDNSLNITKKFQLFIDTFFRYGENNELFAEDLHKDKNLIIHQKMTDKTIKLATPLLLHIINEGIHKEVFSLSYPEETLEILVPGMMDYIHRYYFCQNKKTLSIKMRAAEDIINRMLGTCSVKLNIFADTDMT